ncbi:BatA domain-containing protein [Aeoliella sp. ICT_H6.2]|uniref:BatA domain-containing protein n=1 Tax=Aeoliella straminimaris TaxID=2954799 RepID=A0A9X2FJV1_9BACT|nr:BatA domain-containing protein [Aeoliella straminimaris]
MSFLYPSVFWFGLPLVALPLVIHLLNLRRQRRVPWAAMQFLLESQERSKTWISLQELLLLLLRTAAIALLIVMLARPTARSGWIGRLLNRPVHHLVVLDDSYSTTDRWAETSAWKEGIGAANDIAQAAADQSTASVVSILRFSEAEQGGEDPRPGIFRQQLDDKSRQEFISRMETAQPTDTASGLLPALRRAVELADLQPPDQDLVVHVVSDFRQHDVQQIDAIQEVVDSLKKRSTGLQFIRTVRQPHENLALVSLEPESGVRATGVEMWMRLAVENYGTSTAREVVVELEQDGSPLVSVPVGDIPAGETVDRRFRATFVAGGAHWVAGSIDADAVELDNRYVYATHVPEAQKVLLVDGSPNGWESYYVGTALAPGGPVKSGWAPVVVKASDFAEAGDLSQYAAVALLDVPRLKDEQLAQVAAFVEAGGGLLVTLGETIRRDYYAGTGFASGEGLFPAPPDLPTQWIPETDDTENPAADIRVTDHPAFSVFRGERNSMLGLMRVNYYYSLQRGWRNDKTDDVEAIASLADGTPLVLEKPYGNGKVVMQLTKVSPDEGTLGSWSNFGPNPAFVVLTNELFGYLAYGAAADDVLTVGDALRIPADRAMFAGSGSIQRVGRGTPYQATLSGDPAADQLVIASEPIERAGLYRVRLDRNSGGTEDRFAAVNPAAGEGNLALAADTTLRQKFAGDEFALRYADELSTEANPSESSWTEVLLASLVLALVAEQALAYVCSFHE